MRTNTARAGFRPQKRVGKHPSAWYHNREMNPERPDDMIRSKTALKALAVLLLLALCGLVAAAQADKISPAGLNEAMKYLRKNQPTKLTVESGKFKPTELLQVKNAIVTAVKIPEDKNGLILRIVSAQEGCTAWVAAPGLKAACLTDFAEQTLSDLAVTRNSVHLDLAKRQSATLRLIF